MSFFTKLYNKAAGTSLLVRLLLSLSVLVGFMFFILLGPSQVLEMAYYDDVVAMIIVCELLLLLVGFFYTWFVKISSNVVFVSVLVVAAAALAIRLYMFDAASGDYNSFLSVWIGEMRQMQGVDPIVESIGDYNMPYLYFLFFVSRSLNTYDLYAIKLFSVVFDFVLAFGVSAIIYRYKKSDFYSLVSFTAALFMPMVFLNSAYWAQCDSIYSALAVIGLCLALYNKSASSVVFFALAFSFKIQTIFILPIILILVLKHKIRLRDLLLFPATFVATLIPAILCGRSFYDTFSIYIKQTESYPSLTLNCPTFWALFPDNDFNTFGTAALFLAGAVCLVFMVYLFINREKLSDTTILDAAFLFVLILPFFLPRMHERYFYLAEIFSIIYALIHKGRYFPLFINLSSFSCYCAYLFGYQIEQFEYLAVLNLVIIIYVAKKLADDISNFKISAENALANEKEPT